MKNLNWYFYQIWLPIQILTVISLALVGIGYGSINWLAVFVVWFLIGPIGIGVGFHRLFSHRQFKTYRPVEYILAFLGSLSTYTPVTYWIAEHQHHHINVDTDADINNPKHGFWHSFLYWRFTKAALKAVYLKDRCNIIASHDNMLQFMSKYFTVIVYAYALVTLSFGLTAFVSFFIFPVLIEQIRINLLNSVAHMNIPFSYQNFSDSDSSYNNIIFGLLSMGFGWHNNHHTNARELVNTHRWWELDIEGLIAVMLSKK